MCLCVCVRACASLSLALSVSLFLSLSFSSYFSLFMFSLSLSLFLSLSLSLFPFVRWMQKKTDLPDGLILIGPGLAKRRAAFYESRHVCLWCSYRLDLLREGGHFYAGAQCRGFLPCDGHVLVVVCSVL